MKTWASKTSGRRLRISRSGFWAMAGAIISFVSWSLASQFVRAQDAMGIGEPDAAVVEATTFVPATVESGLDGGTPSTGGHIDGGETETAGPETTLVPSEARTMEADQPATQASVIASEKREPTMMGRPAIVVETIQKRSSLWSSAGWGVGADIGLSGPLLDAGLLLAFRPSTWMHLHAGGGYNGFAYGVRGGATLINPFAVPLSVTCEVGHYFEGDANKVVRWFSNDVQEIASLRRFSYDYLNLLGGLEFGGRRFSFYVRGGVTWMRTTIKDFAQSVHDASQVDLQASNPKVMYRGPTLKIGTRYFF
jgi:hypothetical protein